MNLPQLDPTWTVGLLTMDPGDVLSPDGRAHPLDAHTPITWAPAPAASLTSDPSASGASSTPVPRTLLNPLGLAPGSGILSPASLLPSLPAHLGARVAVGVVAIILVAIVAWRLTT